VAKIGKNWLKLTDFQIKIVYFYVFQVVEYIRDSFRTITLKKEILQKKSKRSIFGQFLPILAAFCKVTSRKSDINYIPTENM
jgi:hypothetical protein